MQRAVSEGCEAGWVQLLPSVAAAVAQELWEDAVAKCCSEQRAVAGCSWVVLENAAMSTQEKWVNPQSCFVLTFTLCVVNLRARLLW